MGLMGKSAPVHATSVGKVLVRTSKRLIVLVRMKPICRSDTSNLRLIPSP